jgi:hypothetical protein
MFQNVIDDWQYRLRKCIQFKGEYVFNEKRKIKISHIRQFPLDHMAFWTTRIIPFFVYFFIWDPSKMVVINSPNESDCHLVIAGGVPESGVPCSDFGCEWHITYPSPESTTNRLAHHVFQHGAAIIFVPMHEIDFRLSVVLFRGWQHYRQCGHVFGDAATNCEYETVINDFPSGMCCRIARKRDFPFSI